MSSETETHFKVAQTVLTKKLDGTETAIVTVVQSDQHDDQEGINRGGTADGGWMFREGRTSAEGINHNPASKVFPMLERDMMGTSTGKLSLDAESGRAIENKIA